MKSLFIILVGLHTGLFMWWIWLMETRISKIETTTIEILTDQCKFLELLYGSACKYKEETEKDG